jgi:hypothetical protein
MRLVRLCEHGAVPADPTESRRGPPALGVGLIDAILASAAEGTVTPVRYRDSGPG